MIDDIRCNWLESLDIYVRRYLGITILVLILVLLAVTHARWQLAPVRAEGAIALQDAALPSVFAGVIRSGIDSSLLEAPGATVRGSVTLPDGTTPFSTGSVRVAKPDGSSESWSALDAEGDFSVSPLAAGDWTLQVFVNPDPENVDYTNSDVFPLTITQAQADNGEQISLPEPLQVKWLNVRGRLLLPDGTVVSQAGVNVYTADQLFNTFSHAELDGVFKVGGLAPGSYWLQPVLTSPVTRVVAPPAIPISIAEPDRSQDLGDISFEIANKHVTGRVTYLQDGLGVADVQVFAYRDVVQVLASTVTAADGSYTLDLSAGSWYVMIQPAVSDDETDYINMAPPAAVLFEGSGEETQRVDFGVYRTSAAIIGRLVDPVGNPIGPIPWSVRERSSVEFRQGQFWTSQPPKEDGTFYVKSIQGIYEMYVNLDTSYFSDWSGPDLDPILVSEGIVDLGDVRLVCQTETIQGRVTTTTAGGMVTGVQGAQVNAWKQDGRRTTVKTLDDGTYTMKVLPGVWDLAVAAPPLSDLLPDGISRQVAIGLDQTEQIVTGVDFTLLPTVAEVDGNLAGTNGSPVNDVQGWAYVRESSTSQAFSGGPVVNGRFSLKLPAGSFYVGVHLAPNSAYTLPENEQLLPPVAGSQSHPEYLPVTEKVNEISTSLSAAETIAVTFTVVPNNSRIQGGFYLDAAHEQPATGLSGKVFAFHGDSETFLSTAIQPDGSYELQVSAGDWTIGYSIATSGFISNPPAQTRVTLASDDSFTLLFTAVEADALINGHVLDPQGQLLNYASVWAHRPGNAQSAPIDTGALSGNPDRGFGAGEFSIPVLSGGEYQVGAGLPAQFGFIEPDVQNVTPLPGVPAQVTLRFRQSDSKITGRLSFVAAGGTTVYPGGAWVYAWSESGQSSGGPTDQDGYFEVNALQGTTWYVGATYQVENTVFYDTPVPRAVTIAGDDEVVVDLEMVLNTAVLPPAASITINPQEEAALALGDGTLIQVPGGALPTSDDLVTLTVTPLVEELPNTLAARPFGFGYAVYAFENTTGRRILQSFNEDVLITFYYTDEMLRLRGASEDSLSPAYFSTSSNSWSKVHSYSVDKTNNILTVSINHFTTFALTIPADGGEWGLFLPLIQR